MHDLLVPAEWDGPVREQADAALLQRIAAHGIPAYQALLQRGQYTRSTGLFYGGTQPCWSNQTLRQLLREHIPTGLAQLAVLDIHTGLGPMGYGEPIHAGDTPEGYARALCWYGPEVTRMSENEAPAAPLDQLAAALANRPALPVGGRSASAPISGAMVGAFRALEPATEVTYLALEFGTCPILEVLGARCAPTAGCMPFPAATPYIARRSRRRCSRPSTSTRRPGKRRCMAARPISCCARAGAWPPAWPLPLACLLARHVPLRAMPWQEGQNRRVRGEADAPCRRKPDDGHQQPRPAENFHQTG
ncbi:MAG: DUF2817 domain-containing protein [Cyanobacteria bacterium]|nr:DUF2817 domain-containing protein [Cyanobacteria bacterium bin.51]